MKKILLIILSALTTNGDTGLAYLLQNYNGGFHSNVEGSNRGIMTIGHDVHLSNVAGNDVLTVKDALGFYDPADATTRTLRGNTSLGALGISSQTDGTDGSAIGLYGKTSPYPGAIHFVSHGTAGEGMSFSNYDGTAWHTNAQMSNAGAMTVGHDLTLASVVPGDVLTVKTALGFYDPSDGNYRTIHGNTNSGELVIAAKTSSSDGAWLELCGVAHTAYPGQVRIGSYGSSGVGALFTSWDPSISGWHQNMMVENDGKVLIPGPNHNSLGTPGTYGLYVGDGILTELVKVASHSGVAWSDFVFNKDYSLMPLSRVEDYVKINKHLPDIPTNDEVNKDGIDLAKMDAKLLQKIEELTLYVIAQEKRTDELQKKIADQTKSQKN
jgi:trimeric autotransporter adhesin